MEKKYVLETWNPLVNRNFPIKKDELFEKKNKKQMGAWNIN